uniref:G-protein coupled receptors family 1 profile domain-containing protein n=2 Tax=Lutzomyia longipalpis TaxID=7200 RepID=A0A1B0CJR0_LUTLO
MDSTSSPALLDGILTTTAPLLAPNATSSATIASLEAPLLPGSTNTLDAVTTIASAANGTSVTPNDGSPIASIFVSVVLLIVILGTIIGNILVCIAVVKVRKLRRPSNYLIVSLAVSDLCVAVLVMPTALIYEVVDDWPFGTFFCDMWVSFDVLSCAASILNLCAISVDRYWAITKPLEYGVKRTPRRMLLCVALVWLGAACISLPPLLILGNEHGNGNGATPVCRLPKFWLPNIRNSWLLLHPAHGDVVCLLPHLPGGTANSAGREAGADASRESPQRGYAAGEAQGTRGGDGTHWVTASEEATLPIGQGTQSFHNAGNHHVSIHDMLATILHSRPRTALPRRQSPRTKDPLVGLPLARLCELLAEPHHLCHPQQGLPETLPGDPLLPLFQPQCHDARGVLPQPIRGASITACRPRRRRAERTREFSLKSGAMVLPFAAGSHLLGSQCYIRV